MYARRELAWKTIQPVGPERYQRLARGHRIAPQSGDVHAVAGSGKRREEADAVIELHGCTMEVVVCEQMVHAYPDLEDALVQVANLTRRRPPQQLQRFVLLEELASVELVDGLHQPRRGRLGAQHIKIRTLQALQGESEFRVS